MDHGNDFGGGGGVLSSEDSEFQPIILSTEQQGTSNAVYIEVNRRTLSA